jgi:hypothetical protein
MMAHVESGHSVNIHHRDRGASSRLVTTRPILVTPHHVISAIAAPIGQNPKPPSNRPRPTTTLKLRN